MKIFVLPIPKDFVHVPHLLNYPAYSKSYVMEADFYMYLQKNKHLLTEFPESADWHYLPVGWTDYYINSNNTLDKDKMDLLESEIHKVLLDPSKTFTVCQHDDGIVFNSVDIITFLASRKGSVGIDLPLLAKPLHFPRLLSRLFPRPFKSSFVGRIGTHPIRASILTTFSQLPKVKIVNGYQGTSRYFLNMLLSRSVIAPRGYGGNSFRFYEAMQMGRVPILIGDRDTRPFKNYINWDECSFYFEDNTKCLNMLMEMDNRTLDGMGSNARKVWQNYFHKQHWCEFVLQELNSINKY